MRIDKVAGGISGYSFVDDDAQGEEDAPVSRPSAPSAPAAPAFVAEDEDEDEEVAPAPVPTKTSATVKKVLKKPTAKP